MSNKIHYSNCPVCNSDILELLMSVKDYTVSKEFFEIAACKKCTLRFTQDVPDKESIVPYSKSDEYISHTDTSKGLINKLYQKVRKRTLKSKRKLIQKETGKTQGNLLDIGSGTGAFVNEMKQNGWQAIGLEPDVDARLVAKKTYDVDLLEMNELWNLEQASFHTITLWHVLEHVHDLQQYVQQLNKLLTKDGRIFIAVPNYTSADAANYKEYWAAWDVPRHLYHFSPTAMQTLIEKNGMKILKNKAMWYDSFYVSMLSSKYKHGKTKLISSFLNGLRSNMKAMSNVQKCSSVIYVIAKQS